MSSWLYIKKSTMITCCYAACSIVSRIINFILLPCFLSKITLSDFGLWDWYQSWINLVMLLGTSLASLSLTRFMLLHANCTLKRNQTLSNALLLCSISMIVVSMALLLGYYYNFATYWLQTCIIIIVYIPFNLMTAYCMACNNLVMYGLLFLGQSVAMSLLTWIFLEYNYGIEAFFWATLYSLLPCTLVFLYFVSCYQFFNKKLLWAQIQFALPLAVHGMLYMLFFIIDRIIIKNTYDFSVLGHHALLVRMGGIFQIVSLSVASAWPLMCFDAHQQKNNSTTICHIITYFSAVLLTGYFGALIASWFGLQIFLPKHIHLMRSLPVFFLPLLALSFAQLLSAGCHIVRNNFYLPWLTAGALIAQYTVGSYAINFSIEALFISNCCIFSLYACANGLLSRSLAGAIVDTKIIIQFLVLASVYAALFYKITQNSYGLLPACMLTLSWPVALLYCYYSAKGCLSQITYYKKEVYDALFCFKKSRT